MFLPAAGTMGFLENSNNYQGTTNYYVIKGIYDQVTEMNIMIIVLNLPKVLIPILHEIDLSLTQTDRTAEYNAAGSINVLEHIIQRT